MVELYCPNFSGSLLLRISDKPPALLWLAIVEMKKSVD